MKYFIYTRKSTESEERQKLFIPAQISELKEFAAKEKLEILDGIGAGVNRRDSKNKGNDFLKLSVIN